MSITIQHSKGKLSKSQQLPLVKLKGRNKKSNDSIFPDWLRLRNDFQQVIRSEEEIDCKDIKRILLIQASERSPSEKQILSRWIKAIPFFSKISIIKIKDLFVNFALESFPQGKIVQKSELDCFFYMVVSGKLAFPNGKISSKEIFTENRLLSTITFPEQFTVVEPTLVLKLTLDQYNEVLLSKEIGEKYEICKFIKKTSFFTNWSIGKIGNLILKIEVVNFLKGEIIYKINDPPSHLYIIKSGLILEQVNVSLNYMNSWPLKFDLKEKLYIKKDYLLEFERYEQGQIFGLCDIAKKKIRDTQAVALKNTQVYAFPIESLLEFLTENEKKQIKVLGEITSEKAILLKAKRIQVRNTMSKSKLILDAFEVNLRPVSNIFKNPEIDRKMACAKQIVYSKIEVTNKELKEVRSHTKLFTKKNSLVKRCESRDESYMYKSRNLL